MRRHVAVTLMAAIALSCVGDLVKPEMATAGGQDCFGSACQDQISCGQPAPPQVSSGPTGHVVALPATVEAGTAPEKTETPPAGRLLARAAWPPVAPFPPRSPPAA